MTLFACHAYSPSLEKATKRSKNACTNRIGSGTCFSTWRRASAPWTPRAPPTIACSISTSSRLKYSSLSSPLTPQNVLNYAAYLEEHNCYEESFRVYEKGLDAFPYPHSREIWLQYLNRFILRYKDAKIERARDIFEKVLSLSLVLIA